jgi:hypothetical protein
MSVSPATANKAIAGIDHGARPTSQWATMNNSPHSDMIVRISKGWEVSSLDRFDFALCQGHMSLG